MDQILARVVELENQGYQFEAAEGSFDLLVRRSPGTYRPHFERLHFHVNVEADRTGQRRDRSHGQAARSTARCATRWPRATAR